MIVCVCVRGKSEHFCVFVDAVADCVMHNYILVTEGLKSVITV